MAVNSGMAHLSDGLFTTAIATYTLAMATYTAEYAFGRRGRVAATSRAEARVLVGAGGPDVEVPASDLEVLPEVPAGDGFGRPASNTRLDGQKRVAGERFGRIAVALTILGATVHAASIALRGIAADRVPWGNMYEFSAVVGFVAVAAFLGALWRAPQIRYLGVFVMLPVILLMFLAGTVLYAKDAPLVPALQSYWLAIHVTAAASSEGILVTSSVFTMLFLIRQRYDVAITTPDKRIRFPVSMGARLPSPETLDKVAYRTVAFAFPIYTFGVIAGAIWAEAAWGRYWGWDPKETWAFIAWVIYAAYLHARATAGWKGRSAAWINLLGFGAMTFNFFVVNIVISGLHSYAGLN
ncbi:MAG TPA: c-type cytochrome biogenesis protein CcsB [Jatrophihabitantaceae bacterium]|nr:c-type cytochrome biogenesis protein CcsB [Jatrophihabitantaceae bacterium]